MNPVTSSVLSVSAV